MQQVGTWLSLVERTLGVGEVASSNLVVPTIFLSSNLARLISMETSPTEVEALWTDGSLLQPTKYQGRIEQSALRIQPDSLPGMPEGRVSPWKLGVRGQALQGRTQPSRPSGTPSPITW